MSQNATARRQKANRMDWRTVPPRPYDLQYLMKLGNLNRQAAAELIALHGADRNAINAELMARKRL